jgi:ribose 5-phosphate isomerase A
MSLDEYKRMAARGAIEQVVSGMRLGLGTGSTAAHFVELLGERVRGGLDVICVPTSEATRAQASSLGIPLTTLDDMPLLDMTVDGVAAASERLIVIADHTKRVERLGAFPLPVEVVRFGYMATQNMIALLAADLGCHGEIRLRTGRDRQPFVTDGGNYIFDCAFKRIDEPERLDEALKHIPGVVENGLFLGLADMAFVAGPEGIVVIETEPVEDDGR